MFFKCFYSDKMRENKISISAGESIKFPFMHVFPYYFSVLSVLDLMLIRNPFAYLCFMTQQELTEEEALLICWMRKKRVQAAEMMVMARLLRGVSAGMAGRLQCVELGIKEWKAMKKTVSFSVCVAESLKARAHRRRRTLEEIRCVTARMVKSWPELRHKMMRGLRRGGLPAHPEYIPDGQRTAQGARHSARNMRFCLPQRMGGEEPGSGDAVPAGEGKKGACADAGGVPEADDGGAGGVRRRVSAGSRADAVCRSASAGGQKASIPAYQAGRKSGAHSGAAFQDGRGAAGDPSAGGVAVFAGFPASFRGRTVVPGRMGTQVAAGARPCRLE